MALNGNRRPPSGRRPLLTGAWFTIRWGSWLVGHPIGISLFTATALLRMPVAYALALGFAVDLGLTVVGRWWPLPAGVMVRLWRRVRGLKRSPAATQSQAGRTGSLSKRSTDRSGRSRRGSRAKATGSTQQSERRRDGGFHPLSRAWSFGLWCGSMSQDSERCMHSDGPNAGRPVIELESCDTRRRSRQWAVSVGFGQRLHHPDDDDYVFTGAADSGPDGGVHGDDLASLSGRSTGAGNDQWPGGGDRQ